MLFLLLLSEAVKVLLRKTWLRSLTNRKIASIINLVRQSTVFFFLLVKTAVVNIHPASEESDFSLSVNDTCGACMAAETPAPSVIMEHGAER